MKQTILILSILLLGINVKAQNAYYDTVSGNTKGRLCANIVPQLLSCFNTIDSSNMVYLTRISIDIGYTTWHTTSLHWYIDYALIINENQTNYIAISDGIIELPLNAALSKSNDQLCEYVKDNAKINSLLKLNIIFQ